MKPTTIIVTDEFGYMLDRGFEGKKDEKTNCKVRHILLQRNGKVPTNINDLENLSNSFPQRIEDAQGNIIFELNQEDIATKNKRFQTYIGLLHIFKTMHTQDYKDIDCCMFFELINGIQNSYSHGGEINKEKYKFVMVPKNMVESGDIQFEVGDVLMSTKDSNPELIPDSLEVGNEDFKYKGFHFIIYLGNGYFISKYGAYHKFSIGTLDEIMKDTASQDLFYLEPKDGVESIYEKDPSN